MQHDFLKQTTRRQGIRRARNEDYDVIGSQYAHIFIWRKHHGVYLDPTIYIIHHKNEVKTDNWTCGGPEPCPIWDCGNLGALTRAEHIRLHKPGRMGGLKIPNKAGKKVYTCSECSGEMSKHGTRCRACYTTNPKLA